MLLDPTLDSTRQSESVCLTIAVGLHALLFFWNPALLQSHFKPTHDFVQIDVVDQPAPGAPAPAPEAPKKSSIFESLRSMLMKPQEEEIAHIEPHAPIANKVAAPVRPQLLQDKSQPRPIATMFKPQSETDDLAGQRSPNAIQTQQKNFQIPNSGPALKGKSYGIQVKDLPFQVGTDQDIVGGPNAAVIPVAVGKGSAKAALGYTAPSLQDAGKRHGIQPVGLTGAGADMPSLGTGGPATIQLSGTGGTGNAPTGAMRGTVLQDRQGSGNGLKERGFGGAGGGGGGIGFGGGGGIPSAAQDLDAQIAANASSQKKVKKNGFDIEGPLNNRGILHKVIPQYPDWAEEQGIIGSVRIWFTVTSEGVVRTNMKIMKTTGYPELDKLAVDALKEWRFSATSGGGDESTQWGIITFVFSLAS